MRRLGVLSLLVLFGCGSGLPTSLEMTTPAQIEAHTVTHALAAKRGIRLDAVIFTNDLPRADYAAWSVCGQYAVAYNAKYLEEERVFPLIPAMAAHEVCHIYYLDNLPCGRDPDSAKVEARAEACAVELLR